MKVAIVVLALVAAASAGVVSSIVAAPTIVARAPQFDSAVIKSDRLGGNFAYSVAENHAYAAHTPIVQHVTSPVAVSYAAGAPIVTSYAAGPVAVGGLGLVRSGLIGNGLVGSPLIAGGLGAVRVL